MDNNLLETERLGRAMAVAARSRPEFVGHALDLWKRANPSRSVLSELNCDEARLWRLAVTPQPKGNNFADNVLALALSLDVNPIGLVNMLRFAQSATAFAGANDDGEMLMAALDADESDQENPD